MTQKLEQKMKVGEREFIVNTRPDTIDFRDKMFVPTLVEVKKECPLAEYLEPYRVEAQESGETYYDIEVLDQGQEGACTGFALAAVIHHLLRTRDGAPDNQPVSARMLYEMARRYDEWPGEEYSGSSARGAMKGWHKHGVCSESEWEYKPNVEDPHLTRKRSMDAKNRPLGAYFRVNHRDIVAMHAAISETKILYATSMVHTGWSAVREDGTIPFEPGSTGGHAFAIVGYDLQGFWIQNSWGAGWGLKGFARISYDDWLKNARDVWVARLGAPINLSDNGAVAIFQNKHSGNTDGLVSWELRPHIVSTGNDGQLHDGGTYGTDKKHLDEIFSEHIPQIASGWKNKRLLLYAHGGLTGEKTAVQRLAENRDVLLANEIYPIAFVWRTGFWSTLGNILEDAVRRRRPEGFLDDAKDFLMDRVDDMLEPIARVIGGKAQWSEMKENARLSTEGKDGGARLLLKAMERFIENDPDWEIHLAGHSAGSVLLGPVAKLLTSEGKFTSGPMRGRKGMGMKIHSLSLWAPACTTEFFHENYADAIREGRIKKVGVYNLSDDAEQDDHCARIYNKSLLYLVSHAFEDKMRSPFGGDGVPLLGLDRCVQEDPELKRLIRRKTFEYILSPGDARAGSVTHGGFDNDRATLRSTLARILDGQPKLNEVVSQSTDGDSERRRRLGDL